jgi:hypothetical protein
VPTFHLTILSAFTFKCRDRTTQTFMEALVHSNMPLVTKGIRQKEIRTGGYCL